MKPAYTSVETVTKKKGTRVRVSEPNHDDILVGICPVSPQILGKSMVSWLNCDVKQQAAVEDADIADFAHYSLFFNDSDFSYLLPKNARTHY
ncbi:MAG: hypothetical protein MUC43_12195 [Pirellula sp.]|nr:hypothetical protein [Pirellula sp.]